jgi:integrase
VVQDVQNFRDTRTRSGVRLSTVSFDVALVRRVLSSANNQGLISNNPAKAVELESSKSQKHSVLSPDDIRALLAEAEPDWRTAILIGYYTGARLSDATSMTWDEVNLSEELITYAQRKTGNQVKVPIHSQLEEHLLAIAGDKNGSLCPSLAGKPGNGRSGLSTQFAKLMIKAGVDRQIQPTSRKRKFSAVSFHSLRHSFVSNLANAGVEPEIRKELAGHTTSEVHDRYTHQQIEQLRVKGIDKLSRLP